MVPQIELNFCYININPSGKSNHNSSIERSTNIISRANTGCKICTLVLISLNVPKGGVRSFA